jgi:hypothetical protein
MDPLTKRLNEERFAALKRMEEERMEAAKRRGRPGGGGGVAY